MKISDYITIAIIFVASIVAVSLVKKLFRRGRKATNEQSRNISRIIEKIIVVAIYISAVIGITTFFPALNTVVKSLLAGSGVVALVISVASQDAISNLVSGFIIWMTKPFQVGDMIRYLDTNIIGTVLDIKMRHTVILTYDETRLIIPNSTINNTVIENLSSGNRRVCVYITVDITYESNADKAMMLFAAVIRKNPEFIDVRTDEEKANGVPAVKVRIRDFRDSSIAITAPVYAKGYDESLYLKSAILSETKKVFAANGIEFAYPHIEVISHKD